MSRTNHRRARGFTLVEIVLVVGLVLLITALAAPRLTHLLEREELPGSGRQLRSLIALVRANAAFDGKRYRIRFPEQEETDSVGEQRQPIVERELDPIRYPEEFVEVTSPWAVGNTLLADVWCAEVRLGRPTIERLQRLREARSEVESKLRKEFENLEEFVPERPPVYVEPDGSSEWATFVLTQAPREIDIEDLEDHPRIELIIEGTTGLAWMQRPFYEEELDLFEDKGWPAVLRQDFLEPRMLTENDVLELREAPLRQTASSEPKKAESETEEEGTAGAAEGTGE